MTEAQEASLGIKWFFFCLLWQVLISPLQFTHQSWNDNSFGNYQKSLLVYFLDGNLCLSVMPFLKWHIWCSDDCICMAGNRPWAQPLFIPFSRLVPGTIPFSQSGFVASVAKSPPNKELYSLPFVAPLLRVFLMFVLFMNITY